MEKRAGSQNPILVIRMEGKAPLLKGSVGGVGFRQKIEGGYAADAILYGAGAVLSRIDSLRVPSN